MPLVWTNEWYLPYLPQHSDKGWPIVVDIKKDIKKYFNIEILSFSHIQMLNKIIW